MVLLFILYRWPDDLTVTGILLHPARGVELSWRGLGLVHFPVPVAGCRLSDGLRVPVELLIRVKLVSYWEGFSLHGLSMHEWLLIILVPVAGCTFSDWLLVPV